MTELEVSCNGNDSSDHRQCLVSLLPPEITFGSTGDTPDSLELVLSRVGETICLKDYFSDLWFMFANASVDGDASLNEQPCHRKLGRSGGLRILGAPCLKSVPIESTEYWTEQNANRSRKI